LINHLFVHGDQNLSSKTKFIDALELL